MPPEQIFIGLTTSALCGAGLYREFWILSKTRKGRWLVGKYGQQSALWILRSLFTAGLIFGLSLALGLINPVHW